MDQIMESVLCVQYTDEPRLRNIIQQAIDAKEVPSYNAFVKESKQKMNARKRRVSLNAIRSISQLLQKGIVEYLRRWESGLLTWGSPAALIWQACQIMKKTLVFAFLSPRYVMLKMILLYGLFEITLKCF